MYDNSNSEPKQSKYNAAVSQIYRLDNLWQAAHTHSRTGQLIAWNWDLDSIWRELAGDTIPKKEKEYYKLNLSISRAKNKRSLLYHLLEKKEIWLRRLQNSQGKGTAYIDDLDDYMNQ